MHDAIWFNGSYNGSATSTPANATLLMRGGVYLDYSEVLEAVDLDVRSGPTNGVTLWFENMLVPNLINNWFRTNNVYIVYIPYGPVMGLNAENSWENFTESDCTTQWMGGGRNWYTGQDWNSTVVATCDEGGMAVLMNGGSEMESPGFYEVVNMTYNGIVYSAQDMITSSLNGFLNYGFK